MSLRKLLVVVTFILSLGFANAEGQVLTTGETGGKGNSAVFVSANGLFPEGLTLFNTYGQYVYGADDNLDLFVIYGNISAQGRTQHYAGVGWNLKLLGRDRAFVDISFFNTFTAPLNKRNEASVMLATPAIVVSRPVTLAGKMVSLYSGLSLTAPVGQVKDKLFTPPETFVTVPMGLSTALSGRWTVYAEFDAGRGQNTMGVGFLRTF